MPEIRQNIATKEWVIIATERANRTDQFIQRDRPLIESEPEQDGDCPFCPGNEEPVPVEKMRFPADGPWQLRVVDNKYPAVTTNNHENRHSNGLYRWLPGYGRHEVIVESRRHNTCPALESPKEVTRTLNTFQQRGLDFAQDTRIDHIIYFKNHGPQAGTSLIHPHAQLVGLPMVPSNVRGRAEEARRHFDDTGTCVYCQMQQFEQAARDRIVMENEHFVAFVPYAAFSPFHMWIMPKQHRSSFLDASPEEIEALGDALHNVLLRLYVGLHDPDYNYVIRSAPLRDPGRDYLHWYVAIVPQVTRAAGFEMGTGMFINVVLPEESAAFLRDVDIK